MLKIKLLHPDILMTLASNGHGSKVLIADGNFPFSTAVPETAKKVFLNFAPDMLSVTDVLKGLAEYIPVESASVMVPADGSSQSIHDEFVELLGKEIDLKKLKRFEFYSEANSSDTCLVIATGETRRFGNILLTLGVVSY